MYTIESLTQQDLDEFFFSDPKLALLGLSDEELAIMHRDYRYPMNPSSNYIGVRDSQGRVTAVFKYEWFTSHCVNFHMYIQSVLHGTLEVSHIAHIAKEYFEKLEHAYKAILMVPSTCEHVMKFAPKHGFVKEGCITRCYFWRQRPVDLVIFGLNLKEEN